MTETNGGSAPPRPRQVLVSGVVAAAACGLLVVTLFDALTRMRSTETRQSVADSLAKHNDLGLSVADVLGVMRGVTFVSGALAAAGVVLAVYALQRHRGARSRAHRGGGRAGLHRDAGGRAAAAAGRGGGAAAVEPRRPRLVRRPARPGAGAGRPRPDPFPAGSPSGPRPGPGSAAGLAAGRATPLVRAGRPAGGRPLDRAVRRAVGAGPVAVRVRHPAAPRLPTGPLRGRCRGRARSSDPAGVVLACLLTWLLCGLVAAFLLILAALLTADTAALVQELQRNPRVADAGLTDGQVIGTLWLVAAIGITWSLSAIALAVLAYRRVEAGRVGLVVSAVLAAIVGLVAFPVGLLNAAGAVTATVLLLRRPAQEWYAARDRDAGGRHRHRRPPDRPPSSSRRPARRSSPSQDQPGKPPVW